jgi:hypothetical protein
VISNISEALVFERLSQELAILTSIVEKASLWLIEDIHGEDDRINIA